MRSLRVQTIGLAGPTEGTTTNPADEVLVVEAAADYTDRRGHHWLTRLDYAGFGLPVEQNDPLEYLTVTQRDVDGLPTGCATPWTTARATSTTPTAT